MKSITVLFACLVLTAGISRADVFASRFKVTNPDGSAYDGSLSDGTGVKLWYYLNDTAKTIAVNVINVSTGSTVATINATDQLPSNNPNSVSWDGSGSTAGGKYYFSVETTGPVYSPADYTIFKFIATGANGKNIYTRGVDANIYPKAKGFGNIYASNADPANNTRLRQGVLRFNADASYYGTSGDDPMLIPSLSTLNSGGTFDWSGLSPWYATVDSAGQIFVSGNGTDGKVYKMKNDSVAPKAFAGGLLNPRGLAVTGTGTGRKVYMAVDTAVWRADLGDEDSLLSDPVLVFSAGIYVRDILIDDDGHLIVALRDTPAGVAPGYVERYDISLGLPKKRADAEWQQPFATGQPTGLAIAHGPDKHSAADDTLYVSVRGSDDTDIGLWEGTDITGFYQFRHIFYPNQYSSSAGGNISANADVTVDYAGNIIYFENGNEEVFMFSPPHPGTTNTEITQTYDTISAGGGATAVASLDAVPHEFMLNQNYPNPFNPSTVISYTLPASGKVIVAVYDVLGNLVKELFNGEAQEGYNAVVWNASDNSGAKVSSGMYMYRVTAQLSSGKMSAGVKRMMLLK